MDYLTKGFADTLYCGLEGDCSLGNVTVTGINIQNGSINFLNVTIINYNVTGPLNVEGNITADYILALIDAANIVNEAWVNESGDTMSGALSMGDNNINDVADITAINFFGIYDWIIKEGVSRKWLFFNGTDLGYNRTTLGTEFYNKSEVDVLVSSTAFDFFFTNDTSDLDGMFNFSEIDLGRPENFLQSTVITTGTNSIFNFSTILGQPEFSELRNGIYDIHSHFLVTTGGKKDVTITPKLYNISADGSNRNLLITFETSSILTTADLSYNLHGSLPETVMLNTNARLMIEFVAEVSGAGGDPTVQIDMEGTTDSHFTLQTSTQAFEKIFLRLDGSTNMTGQLNGITGLFSDGLIVPTLSNCDTINTTADGTFVCGDDATGGGGGFTNNSHIEVGNIEVTGAVYGNRSESGTNTRTLPSGDVIFKWSASSI